MPRNPFALRPVHSEKEEIVWSFLVANASTTQNVPIVEGVDNPTTAGQVQIGATVRSVFFEINIGPQTTSNPKIVHWIIEKLPSLGTGNDPSVYDAVNKKQVLKRGMEMLPTSSAIVYKRVFVLRIPPRLRRFADGDKLNFRFKASSSETINVCGIAIYKVFT